ncbi:MAG: glycosyltransferase, partial [Pseudomonadota bacterium]
MKPSGFFANVTGLIGRTRSVYDRFFVANFKRSRGPFRLRGQDDSAQGCIETVTYTRGQIGVKGWCLAPGISIRLGATEVRSTPSLERNDVADALGCDPRVGFMLDIPLDEGPIEFETISDTLSQQVQLKTKPPVPRRRDRVRLFAQFMVQVSLSLPDVVRYLRRGDETSLRHIKRCLGLVDDASANGMKMQLSAFNAPDAADGEAQQNDSVSIILPVFNAFSLLPSVLERVIDKTEIPFHLIIIEDQSTDERVRPFLQEWTARQTRASHRITLIEAQENRGFVRSVNAGLEIAEQEPNAPVVLLNSDALVPSGWATRLLAPMRDDPTIASVTPLSNDAEILTIPAIGSTIDLGGAEVDAVDDTLRSAMDPKWGQKLDLPTGVGFCMAMNPAFLKQVPRLDTEFGRGYGEEVDWCQKTRQLGGRHVAACNLFVGHCGGQSFGTQKKRKLVSENNAIVSRRYPKYDAEVAAFAATDPLTTPRM